MQYNAADNLEVMKEAKNYNNFLADSFYFVIKRYNYKKILDFGCSDGYFIEKILEKDPKLSIEGIEIDENFIKMLKNKDIKVFSSVNETEEKYDFIYSLNTLEHIKNDEEEVFNLCNKLKKEGRLFLFVPAFAFLFSSMDEKTGHYRRYSKKKLEQILNKNNFKIEKIEYCDALGAIFTLLYIIKDKFLNNKGNINKIQIKVFDFVFPFGILLDKIIFSKFFGKNLMVLAKKMY